MTEQRTSPLVTEPDVTVVMCARERFGTARDALESLYSDQSEPFNLIYVDGGSPRRTQRYLADESRRRGFRLIQTNEYLTPNEARNRAIPELRTKYVAFVDNDVVFARGWLEALKRCAEETGADIVTPLICYDEPIHALVHFAGGKAEIAVESGRRTIREVHRLAWRRVSEIGEELVRQRTELAEFHCMLVKREVFDRHGPLDENLPAAHEHVDLCLTVRAAGGSIVFEPGAVITFVLAGQPRLSDLPYFFYRWSDELVLASEIYFHRKWGVEFNDACTRGFVTPHRRTPFSGGQRLLQKFAGWRLSMFFCDKAERPFVWLARRRRPRMPQGSVRAN